MWSHQCQRERVRIRNWVPSCLSVDTKKRFSIGQMQIKWSLKREGHLHKSNESSNARGKKHELIDINHIAVWKVGVATKNVYIESSDSISWIRSASFGVPMPKVAPRGGQSADTFLVAEPGQLGAGELDPDRNARRR